MVSVGSVLVNVVLNLALVRVLGYRGLALGTSHRGLAQRGRAADGCCGGDFGGIEGRAIAVSFARDCAGVDW